MNPRHPTGSSTRQPRNAVIGRAHLSSGLAAAAAWGDRPMRRMLAVMLAGLVGLVGLVATAPASAQIRPAYTKNVDEPGRLPYTASLTFDSSGTCFGCSGAQWDFLTHTVMLDAPPVPAGKRLVVQWISGGLPSVDRYAIVSFTSARSLNSTTIWSYPGPYIEPFPGPSLFRFSTPAFVTVEPGQSPHLMVQMRTAAMAVFGQISINGYLIDATN